MNYFDDRMKQFYGYIQSLEKRNKYEDVHSPNVALRRAKAKRLLREMMVVEGRDCSDEIYKFWKEAIYKPFNYFKSENNDMERGTLLMMFVGELYELLTVSARYMSQLCVYLGDVHRYMPKDMPQHVLAKTYYEKAIKAKPNGTGRAYYALCSVVASPTLTEKLRLLILAELAENPYDTEETLKNVFAEVESTGEETPESDRFLIFFVKWATLEKSTGQKHLMTAAAVLQMYKKAVESCPDAEWPMILSACNMAAQWCMKKNGYCGFRICYEVIMDILNDFYSKNVVSPRMLAEALSWMSFVGGIFGSEKHQLSYLMKYKWNKLTDSIVKHLNETFDEIPTGNDAFFSLEFHLHGPRMCPSKELLWYLVRLLCDSPFKSIERNPNWEPKISDDPEESEDPELDEPLFRQFVFDSPKKLAAPMEKLVLAAEPVHDDSWKPVYTLIDLPTMWNNLGAVRKIWEMEDFIHVLPYSHIDQLDRLKKGKEEGLPARNAMRLIQTMGPRLRIEAEWGDEHGCLRNLIKTAARKSGRQVEGDHEHIVGYICQTWQTEEPIEGVTCYSADSFLKKCRR